MSEQSENKAVVERFFAALDAWELDKAFALVSDDASWWVPGTLPFSGTKTKAEYAQIVERIKTGFPGGLKFTVHSMTAEDDRVAAEASSAGDHVNGKAYHNRYHFLFTVRDGSIVAVKEYMDTLHLATLISG